MDELKQAAADWVGSVATYERDIEDESPMKPGAQEGQYHHHHVKGDGDSGPEAITDWRKNLPTGKFHTIVWRVRPELATEVDFDTKKRLWRVWSRFALIPFADAQSAAA